MKRLLAWIMVALALVLVTSPAPLVQAQATGEPVRVGLYHGSKTFDEVRLSSAGGLVVGVLPATTLHVLPLITVQGATDWRIRHEAIRLEFGPYDSLVGAQAAAAGLSGNETKFVIAESSRYYVRYGSFSSADVANHVLNLLPSPYKTGSLVGMYRTASAECITLEEAQGLQHSLQQAGRRADLLYTGSGWRVLVGHSQSATQAEQLGIELSTVFPGSTWEVVVPDQRRSEVYQHDGTLHASFAVDAGDVYVGAASGVDGKPPLVTISANGSYQYRGFMQLSLQSDLKFQVNNYLTMDQYLMGVVPREMSWKHPIEALKAQAVAARSYAEYNRGKHSSSGFDFCPTVDCQVYADYSWEGAPTQEAVALTSGVVMTYAGKPVAAFFHSDSGGHTESVENVWSYPIAYLQGAPELYPSGSEHQDWEVVLSQSELQNIVAEQKSVSIGTIASVEALSYTNAGRVMKLRVTGANGTVDFDKEQARLKDNGYRLIYRVKSRMYTVKPQIPEVHVLGADGNIVSLNPHGLMAETAAGTAQLKRTDSYNLLGAGFANRKSNARPEAFVFTGHGFGHGIGMSQLGASAMAKNGHTFEEILKHYYRGITVEKVGK